MGRSKVESSVDVVVDKERGFVCYVTTMNVGRTNTNESVITASKPYISCVKI